MTDSSGNPMGQTDDYSLVDFMSEADFDQFIARIRGENADPIVNFCPNYLDCENINGCSFDNQFNPPTTFSDPSSLLNSFPCELKEWEDENSAEKSSATITTSTTTARCKKGDKSRIIISERRRRGRMKEKLYALRAVVPNITKMDKASIVGDAGLYVQELQMQAKKLRADIERLESSLKGVDKHQRGSYENAKKIQITNTHPISKKILQIDVFQVEDKGIYVRVVCNKGQGVAAALYKALDSFTNFIVQSSNLATADGKFLLTFTLNIRELCEMDMDLANLKLWVAGALLNQGFDFRTSSSSFLFP